MLDQLDRLLDRVTMYRLLLYYLIFLALGAAGLSDAGYLHFGAGALVFSTIYLVAVCWIVNHVLAYIYDAPTNPESNLITALILSLIITPSIDSTTILFLSAAGVLAMAAKYMLAWHRKHLFNPAAIAVLLTSLGGGQSASWWVGSGVMLPFVLAGGLLLARRIRRFQMIAVFVAVSYVVGTCFTLIDHGSLSTTLRQMTFSSSLFFLAFVMLTEPQTSPTQARQQRWYAGLVGALFPPQVHVGSLAATPEIALAIGNIFSQLISPKVKLFPRLIRKVSHSPRIADFIFQPDVKFSYQPGQYMEWTLPHEHADSRGERRYFTLASSPTEPEVRLGVKFYENGSSYKRALSNLSSGSTIVASQLGGDFVLPDNRARKLAFIAGGVGVTPYRSMLKYLLDRGEQRNIAMLYAANSAEEIVYKDILEAAREKLGADVTYCINQRITAEMIKRQIPDYKERLFYVSGPRDMTVAMRVTLRELGVSRRHIKLDFFAGYS